MNRVHSAGASVDALKPGDLISRKRGGDYTFVRKSRTKGFITAICHEHNVEESWPVEHFQTKDTTYDR